jgi:hypothetical protein
MTKKQTELMVLIQDLILAFVINSTATILAGGMTDTASYLCGMMQAFCINYIAGLIIPVNRIGGAVAHRIGFKEGELEHKLVRIFIINAIFVTIISFTIALLHCGAVSGVGAVWWETYPILHLVGYITSVLIESPCQKWAMTLIDNKKE